LWVLILSSPPHKCTTVLCVIILVINDRTFHHSGAQMNAFLACPLLHQCLARLAGEDYQVLPHAGGCKGRPDTRRPPHVTHPEIMGANSAPQDTTTNSGLVRKKAAAIWARIVAFRLPAQLGDPRIGQIGQLAAGADGIPEIARAYITLSPMRRSSGGPGTNQPR